MQYSKVLDKLQNLIKRKISQKELCKILNIKQSAMGNRASRDSHFSDNEINILEKHYKMSYNIYSLRGGRLKVIRSDVF